MALDVQELRPGLWRWTAPHPEWKPEKGGAGGWEEAVGCVYVEAPGVVVLIDPLAPPAGSLDHDRFWSALDRDVRRRGLPVAVLLANHYHVRNAAEVVARYAGAPGSSLWAHEAARGYSDLPPFRAFREGDSLPGGIGAHSLSGLNREEVAFYLPEHRALVVADALLGAGGGELRVAPASWAENGEPGRRRYESLLRPQISRLLDLDVERVLVSHGPPVLSDGRAAIERALRAPEWGA